MKILKHTLRPMTPVQGIAAMPFTFDTPGYRALVEGWRRTGRNKRYGAKQTSHGFILAGLAYYWCPKGYYRCGKGDRRPIQHILWEQRTGKPIPKLYEIWFKDRDRHNFTPANMELIHKAELHARCMANGEVPKMSSETRHRSWETRGFNNVTKSRSQTALLLQRFEKEKNHEHSDHQPIGHLVAARDAERRAKDRAAHRAAYHRRKAGIYLRPRRRDAHGA